ncbi:hypothetical protein R6Z07F_001642 [Ovis aries]
MCLPEKEWKECRLHTSKDINECSADNGGCQDQCCNTIGSYYCKCQAGQKLEDDGRGRRDVDECAVVNGGCQQRCINTLGTFHCECDTGYRLHADERTCITFKLSALALLTMGAMSEMDPCTGGNGCAYICQSENGVARCACHPGYQLSEDKKACADLNECTERLAPCSHRCVNTVGSFTCACQPGFELGADGKQCYRIELEIVNSCEKNNGGCSHHCEHACDSGEACCAQLCINYSGGYECSCQEGFQISSDGCGCDDVDECLDVSIICDQLCINSVGTYECSCEEGYRIGSDGKTCIYDEPGEEEELDIVKFPGLLCKSPPQLLHYVATSLPLSYEDEDHEEEEQEIPGELTDLHNVVCLDHTFGHECSLSCEDCMSGGRCQEGKSECSCPNGWRGILFNETRSPETSVREYDDICDCQNGGTCDPLTGRCKCPPGIHGKTCGNGCPKGFFGKNCKKKCNCANNSHCHRVYVEPVCVSQGAMGDCPKGAYGAGCSSECQCVEENTLECSARNGSCTCKSGYQGNRCQRACPDGLWGSACQFFCGPCENGGCPKGTYGPYCQRKCKCLNGGSCDTMIGTCDCLPDFIRADCSQTCPEDYYGQDCVQRCSCVSGQCDPMEAVPVPLDGQEIIVKKNVFLVILVQAAILIARVRTMEFAGGFLEECEYLPGYYGRDCEHGCRSGQYGPNCPLKCQCAHTAHCDPLNGHCDCPPKRMGPTCEENGLDDPQQPNANSFSVDE